MYKKMLCCLLAFALVLASGGVNVILPVNAVSISDGEMGTIEMMNDFTDDAVIIVLTHEASLQFIDYTPEDFPEIECAEIEDLSDGKGAKVQAVLRGEQLEMNSIGARIMNQDIDIDSYHRILYLKLANPGKGNVLRAVMALEQREDIYSAEPNYILQLEEPIAQQDTTQSDDPVYGYAAAKIQLEDAWEIETGSSGILVGVVDSGIDIWHPELSNKVNRTLSRDFIGDGYAATQDPNGHGTHVAGIIAAEYKNDELNFSGVCQSVTLVSLRVAKRDNSVPTNNVIDAIDYADDINIPILNLSLSIGYWEDTDLVRAVANYSGLMICAAGNNRANINNGYAAPACMNYGHIISVGATTSMDLRWVDSNYGSTAVDLFAPGYSILSCYPLSLCPSTNCNYNNHARNYYHYMDGTSMAAPFVTGVAALIWAHNPNASRYTVKNIILGSTDWCADLVGDCVTNGRLNAYKALSHPDAHQNVVFTYTDGSQHTRPCQDCGEFWMEDHAINPGTGYCIHCGG